MRSANRRTSSFPALSLALLLLSACAKTGDPQPPFLKIPRPAADLAARQIGDEILLTVSPPTVNTDGSAAETLREIEVFRLAEGRARSAGPIPEEDFLRRAQRILSVPADRLGGYLEGEKLVFRDRPELPDPGGMYGSGFRYATRYINENNQTAGLGNQVLIAPVAIPEHPSDLSFELFQERILIRWRPPDANVDGSVPARVAGYNVYRSLDPSRFAAAPLNTELLESPQYEDRAFEFDETYYYAVSIVGSREGPYAESRPSPPLTVPAVDRFPPGTPGNLQAVPEGTMVLLLWSSPAEPDVAGYRVYRREEGTGERRLLVPDLVRVQSHRDESVQPGAKYEYAVAAVDTHGNEGPAATVTVEVP